MQISYVESGFLCSSVLRFLISKVFDLAVFYGRFGTNVCSYCPKFGPFGIKIDTETIDFGFNRTLYIAN